MAQGTMRKPGKGAGAGAGLSRKAGKNKVARASSMKKVPAGMKLSGGKLVQKKGSYARAPKKAEAVRAAKESASLTKAIIEKGITVAASKALQNKETISLGDVRGKGKEYSKVQSQLRNLQKKTAKEKARKAVDALQAAAARDEEEEG